MPSYRLLLSLMLLAGCNAPADPGQQPVPEPAEILRRSLQFHDPQGQWPGSRFRMVVEEPRTQFAERQSTIVIDLPNESFEVIRAYDGVMVRRGLSGDSCYNYVDGTRVAPADTAVVQQFRLGCERTQGYRSFYQLLTGLPMTLFSPDVSLNEEATAVTFGPYACYSVRARLNNPVISEEWLFYFDQQTYQLRGYQSAGAGAAEYLELDGLVQHGDMYLPRMRHWYSLADSVYLGSDIIMEMEAL